MGVKKKFFLTNSVNEKIEGKNIRIEKKTILEKN